MSLYVDALSNQSENKNLTQETLLPNSTNNDPNLLSPGNNDNQENRRVSTGI